MEICFTGLVLYIPDNYTAQHVAYPFPDRFPCTAPHADYKPDPGTLNGFFLHTFHKQEIL